MRSEIVFAADHTGWLRHYSAFSGEATGRLRWWMERRGQLRIVAEWDGEGEEEGDPGWPVEMEFCCHRTDTAVRTVLGQRGVEGSG